MIIPQPTILAPRVVSFQSALAVLSASNTGQCVASQANIPNAEKILFNKLWIYPGNAVSGGALTANAATIYVGKRSFGGVGVATIFPDALATTDLPLLIQLQPGDYARLSDVWFYGTSGDGVFLQWT